MGGFSLTLSAPPRAVFDYLTDPRRRPEWQASLRSVEMLDDGPPRLHTRWIDHTVVGASPRLRIVEMREPAEVPGVWREVGDWHGLQAELALSFGPHVGGTLLTGTIRVTSAAWLLPLRVLLQVLAPTAVASDVRRAGRILASGRS